MLNKQLILNSIIKLNKFIKDHDISSREDFVKKYIDINEADTINIIDYADGFRTVEKQFQNFLKNRILNSYEVQRMDGKGRFIIRRLCKAYITNPRQLHDSTIDYVFRLFKGDDKEWSQTTKTDLGEMRNEVDSASLKTDPRFLISLLRAICDHIAGMTDNFAISEYKKLYG
jgi:dGTPase